MSTCTHTGTAHSQWHMHSHRHCTLTMAHALTQALHTHNGTLLSPQMFVIKSGWYDSVEMMEGLMNESHVLSKIPPHDNITTFIGAMLEEWLMEDDRVLQKCHIFTELAESKARGRGVHVCLCSIFTTS